MLARNKFKELLLPLVFITFSIKSISSLASLPQEQQKFPDAIYSLPNDYGPIFLVDKSERKLYVVNYENNLPKIMESYTADIGKNTGDKQKENDYKTPVGIYFLEKRLKQPEISFQLYGTYAFTTDYPNVFDRRASKSGSGIWLHAVPDTIPMTRGSRGCVVVRDNVIKKLDEIIILKKTALLIFDEIKWLTQIDYQKKQSELFQWLTDWKASWISQNHESYFKYYHEKFKNDGMNLTQWKKHKEKVKNESTDIKIDFSEQIILANQDQYIFKMMQNYESSSHKDQGLKTIYAQENDQKFIQIVREDWKAK